MLKLADCEGLHVARLASPTLESLQLSQCRWLERVELDCPVLTQVRHGWSCTWFWVAGWRLLGRAWVGRMQVWEPLPADTSC